jgi:hypothetical protein
VVCIATVLDKLCFSDIHTYNYYYRKACVIHSKYTYIHSVKKVSMMDFFFHHQPINVLTAGAQAFLMDYTKENGP